MRLTSRLPAQEGWSVELGELADGELPKPTGWTAPSAFRYFLSHASPVV